MLKSRRLRVFVLLLGVLGLLVGPSAMQATAQTPPNSLTAVVTGRTNPPESDHSLGANRVSGPSAFHDDFEILAAITCGGAAAVANLSSPTAVEFESDDDVTDGNGTIEGGDTFAGTSVGTGAGVSVAIDGGTFTRVLGIVEVDLTVDVTVGTCVDNNVELRIVFELLPDVEGFTPADPLSGFLLVGVATRHGHVNGDRTRVTEEVCDNVRPHSTRLDLEGAGAPGGPGRNTFHPCADDI